MPLLAVQFPFSNDPIDVVIPCAAKDRANLELCIEGIRTNGANIRRVIVVSKIPLTNRAEWFSEANYPFSWRDVAIALAKDNLQALELLLREGARTGWYFQQLLKLYAPLIIPGISPNVLILDADVVFLNPVTFLNKHNGGLYNFGTENYPHYFTHAARLLPNFKKCFEGYSGICHHMLFQKPAIEALMAEVEQTHNGPFWRSFCHMVDPNEILYAGASEYEIYFNFVFSNTKQVSLRPLQWANLTQWSPSRKSKIISDYKKKGYHYVCFHTYK